MSEEIDRLIREFEKQRISSAPVQDPLVFVLRGKEIQDLLFEQASKATRLAADALREEEEIRAHFPDGFRSASPASASDSHSRQAHEPPPPPLLPFSMGPAPPLHRRSEMLGDHARIYRFLAAHVEESRIFRLGIHDLSFLGLGVAGGGYPF